MTLTRREFVARTSLAAAGLLSGIAVADDGPRGLIIDTHQHLWDLSWQKLPWLNGQTGVLNRNYVTRDYLEATRGLNVRAVYMEVDVAAEQHRQEAEHVVRLSRDGEHPTVAAVVGGRPADAAFGEYVKFLKQFPEVKGIRQVLHGSAPAGSCLAPEFVGGVRLLGENGLSFDLCMRAGELADGLELTRRCPETRFILDHCGNADINVFRPGAQSPSHDPDRWKRDVAALAERPNVICKISGIIARAQDGWTSDDLAPVVNHCLDSFGPERVIFGGDWPVCLLGATLRQWVDALTEIVSGRPRAQQQLLWSGNALRFFDLPRPG